MSNLGNDEREILGVAGRGSTVRGVAAEPWPNGRLRGGGELGRGSYGTAFVTQDTFGWYAPVSDIFGSFGDHSHEPDGPDRRILSRLSLGATSTPGRGAPAGSPLTWSPIG